MFLSHWWLFSWLCHLSLWGTTCTGPVNSKTLFLNLLLQLLLYSVWSDISDLSIISVAAQHSTTTPHWLMNSPLTYDSKLLLLFFPGQFILGDCHNYFSTRFIIYHFNVIHFYLIVNLNSITSSFRKKVEGVMLKHDVCSYISLSVYSKVCLQALPSYDN